MYHLLLTIFVCILKWPMSKGSVVNSSDVNDTLECTPGWIPVNDHCYKYFHENISMIEANDFCMKQNGYLASFNSTTELLDVSVQARNGTSGNATLEMWIGLSLRLTWTTDNNENVDVSFYNVVDEALNHCYVLRIADDQSITENNVAIKPKNCNDTAPYLCKTAKFDENSTTEKSTPYRSLKTTISVHRTPTISNTKSTTAIVTTTSPTNIHSTGTITLSTSTVLPSTETHSPNTTCKPGSTTPTETTRSTNNCTETNRTHHHCDETAEPVPLKNGSEVGLGFGVAFGVLLVLGLSFLVVLKRKAIKGLFSKSHLSDGILRWPSRGSTDSYGVLHRADEDL